MGVKRLDAEAVYRTCDTGRFSFNTTAELEPLETLSEALGQPRAVESLNFGTGMKRRGFNIFVLGPPGTGRHRVVRQLLNKQAEETPVPSDWCYVNNFDNTDLNKVTVLYCSPNHR